MSLKYRDRLREKLAGCIETGRIMLSSGKVTDFYFDGRLVTLDSEGSLLVGELMLEQVIARGVQAIGGLTSGADPIISSTGLLAWQKQVPLHLFFVRKERKQHGTQKRMEGPSLPRDGNLKVALVDDVLTTGNSLLTASEAVREEMGITPELAIVIVDREEGGTECLATQGLEVVSLFKKSDFVQAGT